MTHAIWGARLRAGIILGLTAALTSCGEVVRQGTSSSYLIITSLQGAPGSSPDDFGNPVFSDVITMIDDVATVFNDLGEVTFALGLKDAGGSASATAPTTNNFITVTRYRVTFIRADGRNVPGVDVPYPFDGAMTVTVGAGGEATAGFNLVRVQSKMEPPLSALRNTYVNTTFSTIAEVTFYGQDQTGRAVTVTGRINVEFGDFSDPDS
jgi:hypothetical protein